MMKYFLVIQSSTEIKLECRSVTNTTLQSNGIEIVLDSSLNQSSYPLTVKKMNVSIAIFEDSEFAPIKPCGLLHTSTMSEK